MKLYSQRNRPSPAHLILEIAPDVRERIFQVFEQYCPNHKACLQQPSYEGEQQGVDAINEIFLDCGIGFELTPFSYSESVEQTGTFGRRKVRTPIYPKIIRRDQHLVHQTVVEEVLNLLSDPRLHVANSEMLTAFTALRDQDFGRAITLAGSSFESLMKTICDLKGWPHDPKATCAKLVAVLKDHSLFPGFYAPTLEGVGTIRNNISEAHGRGPRGVQPPTQANAEHMIHMTASHMLFLAKLAGLG